MVNTMHRTLKIFCYFIILSSVSGCLLTTNANLNEGIHHFQIQNYRQAFIRLKPAAEKGIPDAQYAVGYMYYYGLGVTESRKQALYWMRCAAKAGQPDAKAALEILALGEPRVTNCPNGQCELPEMTK